MKTSIAALILAFTSITLAQEIDNSDIPSQCAVVCSNLATVAADCDRAFDRDSDELQCICQATNAQQVLPVCAACVSFYDDDDDDRQDDDNDVADLRRDCSFSSTAYDPSVTYSQAAMTAATSLSSTSASARVTSATGSAASAASSSLSQLSQSLATATGSAASAASSAISSVSSAASGAVASATGNAAAGSRGGEMLAAGAGAGLLAAAAFL